MRNLGQGYGALVVALLTAATARAGVYSTIEKEREVTREFREFRNHLIFLRQLSSPLPKEEAEKTAAESPEQKRYRLVGAIFQQNSKVVLTDEERLNLGA